jgi:pyridoxine 4-dehydrogenase
MVTFSTNNVTVGDIGYGLMGLTWNPPSDMTDEKAFKCMKTALEQGCNFWNGGEFYGTTENNSLTLLKKYFEKYPEDADKVVLSIKGCISYAKKAPDASPANIRVSVETCISWLGPIKKIDFFEPARIDPTTPIEETVSGLVEMIKEGKIGAYMLSEASAATIRRAHKVHPVSGVELEVSLWATDPLTDGAAKACAELGIPIIAYSPVGRGMLTGQIKTIDDIPEGSLLKMCPRFQVWYSCRSFSW